jgi:hypothetical protein
MAGGQLNQVASMLAGSQGMQGSQPQTGPMQGYSPQAMSGLARLMGQGPGVQRNTFQPKTYQPQYQANFTDAIQRQQAAMNPILAAMYGGSTGPAANHGAFSGNSLSGNVNPGFSGTQPAAPVFGPGGVMLSPGSGDPVRAALYGGSGYGDGGDGGNGGRTSYFSNPSQDSFGGWGSNSGSD